MTKKTKKYVTALFSALFVVFTGLAVGLDGANVYAEEPVVSNTELSDLYNYGETVTLSGGAEIDYKGQKIKVEKTYLVYPDGSAKVENEYVLDTCGTYDAVFEGTADGRIVTAKKQFTVKKSFYSVSDDSC